MNARSIESVLPVVNVFMSIAANARQYVDIAKRDLSTRNLSAIDTLNEFCYAWAVQFRGNPMPKLRMLAGTV